MKYKMYNEATKIQIVTQYLNGASITNLTRQLWPNKKVNHHRKCIYLWIKKYGNCQDLKNHKRVSKIKKPRKVYHLRIKKAIVKRYLEGETALSLVKELWPHKNPYSRKSFIYSWTKDLIKKKIIKYDVKKVNINKKRKKVNYEDFSKEELIEILKIYDKYNKILDDERNKKNKFKAINQHQQNALLNIKKLCYIFGVSKSGYYNFIKRKNKESSEVNKLIFAIFYKHNRNIGYRRVTKYLNKKTQEIHNHKKVYRIMKKLNLKCEIRRPRATKEVKHIHNKFPYLIERNFSAKIMYEKIFSDVTYIQLFNNKCAYFSALIDVKNNQILDGTLSEKNDKNLIIKSTKNALKQKPINIKPIINTDHGFVYFSNEYQNLSKNNFRISMSRIGNCLDNRPIEYFFSILKTELINKIPFQKRAFKLVNQEIKKFIFYYNNNKIQSSLNYMSPIEYNK